MSAKTKKFARTGIANISVANPNLNGTGTIVSVLSGGTNGSTVSSIIIKATANTTQGMVRLFIYDSINYFLWREISIPANIQTSVQKAFQITVMDELILDSGHTLYASTQVSENFNVIANATEWENCACSEACACGSQQSSGHTGIGTISSPNSNLNGTGNIEPVLTSPSGALVFGSFIPSIEIKATGNTLQGMVRLFIDDTSTKHLIWEVPIPATTQSSQIPAYRTRCIGHFPLECGFTLCASTEKPNSFNVITFASDVMNCEC